MKPIRTLLALGLVSAFASSAALAEGCHKSEAKSEKSSCCTSSDKEPAKGCCAEKSSSCCGSSAQKDPRKGQTPSGK